MFWVLNCLIKFKYIGNRTELFVGSIGERELCFIGCFERELNSSVVGDGRSLGSFSANDFTISIDDDSDNDFAFLLEVVGWFGQDLACHRCQQLRRYYFRRARRVGWL